MSGIHRNKSRESKVSDFDVEVLVKKDVGSFDVTVDDGRLDGVEIGESSGGLNGDVEADRPGKRGAVVEVTVEVVGDGAVGNELVDEEEFTAVAGGGAVKRDEVLVAETGEDGNFVHELLGSFVVVPV